MRRLTLRPASIVRAKASSSSAKPDPAKPARISAYAAAVLGKAVCVKAAANGECIRAGGEYFGRKQRI